MNKKKPTWLKAKLPTGEAYYAVLKNVEKHRLHTVCQSGQCPNIGQCWSEGTATFMILGNVCTRRCAFCAIATGRPSSPDLDEPNRVADSVSKMNLKHCVITSVTRDDLPDGGAAIWAETIRCIREKNPNTTIEVLIPDFRGNQKNLDSVLQATPHILNHNLETVERLQKPIRKTACYQNSLWVLHHSKAQGFVTKSGLMLGIGETQEEIEATMRDLRSVGCDILTIGQYLQPSEKQVPIDRWVSPAEFERWREFGVSIGFGFIESGPLVRSSYHAKKGCQYYFH